jgi:hypothetical protein
MVCDHVFIRTFSLFCILSLGALLGCENLKNSDSSRPEDVIVDKKSGAELIELEEWQSLRVKDFVGKNYELVVLCLGDMARMPKDLDKEKTFFAPMFLFPGSHLQVKTINADPANPQKILSLFCKNEHPININSFLEFIDPLVKESSHEYSELNLHFQGPQKIPPKMLNFTCRSMRNNPLETREDIDILLSEDSKMIYQHRFRPVKRKDPKKFLRMVVCTP